MKASINIYQEDDINCDSIEVTVLFIPIPGGYILNCLHCCTHKVSISSMDDNNFMNHLSLDNDISHLNLEQQEKLCIQYLCIKKVYQSAA